MRTNTCTDIQNRKGLTIACRREMVNKVTIELQSEDSFLGWLGKRNVLRTHTQSAPFPASFPGPFALVLLVLIHITVLRETNETFLSNFTCWGARADCAVPRRPSRAGCLSSSPARPGSGGTASPQSPPYPEKHKTVGFSPMCIEPEAPKGRRFQVQDTVFY